MYNTVLHPLRNLLYSSLSLILCLYISWHALLSVNFFYGFWHDNIGIAETIAETGPQNRYRQHFEDTDRSQRIELFKDICHAITHQGEGLRDIYYSPTPETKIPLLHKAEIIHLQDVANLITLTQHLEPYMLIAWLVLTALYFFRSWPLPSYLQLLAVNSVLIVSLAAILLFGWVEVFYAAHRWIFPDDHQWFFFYQDSLMSMMMQAPDLFLYIGITMLIVAIIIFASLHSSLRRIQTKWPTTSQH